MLPTFSITSPMAADILRWIEASVKEIVIGVKIIYFLIRGDKWLCQMGKLNSSPWRAHCRFQISKKRPLSTPAQWWNPTNFTAETEMYRSTQCRYLNHRSTLLHGCVGCACHRCVCGLCLHGAHRLANAEKLTPLQLQSETVSSFWVSARVWQLCSSAFWFCRWTWSNFHHPAKTTSGRLLEIAKQAPSQERPQFSHLTRPLVD